MFVCRGRASPSLSEIGGQHIALVAGDLPLKFHPVAIRASAVDTPFGAD
jgi:hypothetical protein